jgi:hypothetical protein
VNSEKKCCNQFNAVAVREARANLSRSVPTSVPRSGAPPASTVHPPRVHAARRPARHPLPSALPPRLHLATVHGACEAADTSTKCRALIAVRQAKDACLAGAERHGTPHIQDACRCPRRKFARAPHTHTHHITKHVLYRSYTGFASNRMGSRVLHEGATKAISCPQPEAKQLQPTCRRGHVSRGLPTRQWALLAACAPTFCRASMLAIRSRHILEPHFRNTWGSAGCPCSKGSSGRERFRQMWRVSHSEQFG